MRDMVVSRRERNPTGRDLVLGAVVEGGVAVFVANLLILHRLRPDLEPSRRYISEYAVGPYGRLMTLALCALGSASGACALTLHRRRVFAPQTRLGILLLGVHSIGTLLAGLFRTDLSLPGSPRTRVGRVHDESGRVAIHAVVPAMALLSWSYRRDPRWRSIHPRGLILALLGTMALLRLRYASPQGRMQRAFFAIVALWLGMTGRRLIAVARGGMQ